MKNKLLLSSALLGSLVIAGSSYAQTTVTGSLALSLKSLDGHNTATHANGSQRSFGRESQLNIQNKGKLNNGMEYAAGFSFEQDGGQVGDFSDENVYIDFISGDTTFTIGVDHIQNTNRTKGVLLGIDAFDLAGGNNYSSNVAANVLAGTAPFIQSPGANSAQSMGVGITQKTPFGSVSGFYAPNNNSGSDDNVGNISGAAATVIETDRESTFEIGFEGGLGVKGLAVHYFYNEEGKLAGQTRDLQGVNYGASYNMGQITAGFTRKETEHGASTLERKQNEFGLAYAVSPTLTLAANYTKIDSNAVSAVDAKSKSIGIGYNLGPVAIVGQMAKMENITHTAGTGDVDVAYVKVTTNF